MTPSIPGIREPLRAGAPRTAARAVSWAASAGGTAAVNAVLLLTFPELRHWFVAPVAVCGLLLGPDIADWERRRIDTFDPQATLALMGLHFFYAAPILHVVLGYWPKYVDPSPDWRQALGVMAVVNAAGLLLYRLVLAPRLRTRVRRPLVLAENRFVTLGVLVTVVSVLGWLALIASLGGPAAFLSSVSSTDRDLAGLEPFFLLAALFPMVVLAMVLVRKRELLRARPGYLVPIFLLFAVASLATGGLGGSRSATVWPLLIGLCMCHLVVRPLRRRALAVVFLVVLAFMYVYGFYKSAGVDSLEIFCGERSTSSLSADTGRDVPGLLLGDLGRSDIQALVLERVDPHDLAWGATYVGDLLFLLPGDLAGAVPNKVAVGTDVLYGPDTYGSKFEASNIYGLAGEAMLNFGAVGGVLVFGMLGLPVRFARTFYRRASGPGATTTLALMASPLPVVVILSLGSDLDNLA